jgi:alpha-ketoglutarate-dependent taurine dioxygenase
VNGIRLERLPGVGTEVIGVDKERALYDEELPPTLLNALEEHGVLVFRGLGLDDATQLAFSERLGEIEYSPGDKTGILVITLDPEKNVHAEYLKGAVYWHLDGVTIPTPPNKATVLTAHVITAEGDATEFASTYTAYEELSAAERKRFKAVKVIHSAEATQRRAIPDPTPEQERLWAKRARVEHPLVWSHRSGRGSLVIGASALSVVGMEQEEGQQLLDELLNRTTRADRVYRHEWSVGDTVIWDNRGTLHRAARRDDDSPRELHRTILAGDEAIG